MSVSSWGSGLSRSPFWSECHWGPSTKKKDAKGESCKLTFVWVKMRTAAQETGPQIALRGCSEEAA